MKAYERFGALKLPSATTKAEQLARLELSSVNFERNCENVNHKTFKANSHAIRKHTPKVRQGKVWREMGGQTFNPSGSYKQSHGKKVRHNGEEACGKILAFHKENMKEVVKK